jgi:hypothetical protein
LNRCLKDGMNFGIDRDVRGWHAVDREFEAVGFGEMEEAADVVVLVKRRKKTLGFVRRELKRGERDRLAELTGQGEVEVDKLAESHGDGAARFCAHG